MHEVINDGISGLASASTSKMFESGAIRFGGINSAKSNAIEGTSDKDGDKGKGCN